MDYLDFIWNWWMLYYLLYFIWIYG